MKPVLGLRIGTRMFLGLPDPDPDPPFSQGVERTEIKIVFLHPENILYFTLKEFHLVSLVLEIMNFHEFRQVTQLCLALASILPA